MPKTTSILFGQVPYAEEENAENRDCRRELKKQQQPSNQLEYKAKNGDESHSENEQDSQRGHDLKPQTTEVRTQMNANTNLPRLTPTTQHRPGSFGMDLNKPPLLLTRNDEHEEQKSSGDDKPLSAIARRRQGKYDGFPLRRFEASRRWKSDE